MCGIVGYIGKRDVAPLLLEGLQRLEYRGYDSAGIVITARLRRSAAPEDGQGQGPGPRPGGPRAQAVRRHHRHRAHPLGHPRRPERRQRAPAPRRRRARSPSSTTASSTTPPSCAPSSPPTASSSLSETDTEVLAHLIARSQAEHAGGEGPRGAAARRGHVRHRRAARRLPRPHRRGPQRLPGRARHRREGDVRRLRRRRAGRAHPPGRHPGRRRDGHPQGRRLPHVHHRGLDAPRPRRPPWSGRPSRTTWAATTRTCTRRSPSRPTRWTACCAAGSTTGSPPCTSAA